MKFIMKLEILIIAINEINNRIFFNFTSLTRLPKSFKILFKSALKLVMQ